VEVTAGIFCAATDSDNKKANLLFEPNFSFLFISTSNQCIAIMIDQLISNNHDCHTKFSNFRFGLIESSAFLIGHLQVIGLAGMAPNPRNS
jgi:hypothetical protein